AFGSEVTRLPKADEYTKDKKIVSVAPIGIDDFDLAGTRLNVRFLFSPDSMRLTSVQLQKFEEKPSMRSLSDYTRLAQLLTEKYGPPTFNQPERSSVDEKITTSWTLPETIIELHYWYMPDIVQSTTLSYR